MLKKTRDPLRVDPIYYVNIDGMNHNAFADAVMDVGDPPCVRITAIGYPSVLKKELSASHSGYGSIMVVT